VSSAGKPWLDDPRNYLNGIVGSPVTVTSGLRSPEHNAAVGGVPNSDHLTGNAFDFVPQDVSMNDAMSRVRASGAPIKQVLNEGNHIHLALNQPQANIDPIDAELAAAHAAKTGGNGGYFPSGDSRNAPAAVTVGGTDNIDAELAAAHKAASLSPAPESLPRATINASKNPDYGNIAQDLVHNLTGGWSDKIDAAGRATLPDFNNKLDNMLGRSGMSVNAPTWSERYHDNLTNIRGGIGTWELSHPKQAYWAKVGGVAGPIAATLTLPELKAATVAEPAVSGYMAKLMAKTPTAVGTTAKSSAIGGMYGLGGTNDNSAWDDAKAFGGGATLGGLFGVGGHAAGVGLGRAAGSAFDSMAGNNTSAGERSISDMLAATSANNRADPQSYISQLMSSTKPLSMMDIGGEGNAFARAGRGLKTLPGQPGKDVLDFLNERHDGSPFMPGQQERVMGDISQIAPNSDAYGTRLEQIKERSVNSDPLYQKAFANAGVGPVDYEAARNDLISATSQKAQIARQIKSIEQNNSGALAARGAAGSTVRSNYMDLQQQLKDAEVARLAAASRFQDAHAGISAMEGNQPLTDERLADFMKDPDIQRGMQRGLQIQKRTALANGEQFDPNAYAITGYTGPENDIPQVGPVPTWRTLHAGREGLDATINGLKVNGVLPKDKWTQSLVDLRKAYGDHLQFLNPDLKAADAAWSTPSQKMDAMTMGGKIFNARPQETAALRGRMNDETRPYYGVGAGQAMNDIALTTPDNSSAAARLNRNQMQRNQIAAGFGPENADSFANNMQTEQQMYNTRNYVRGGSNTADKLADQEGFHAKWTGPGIRDAITGFAAGGLKGMVVLPTINAAQKVGANWAESLLNNPNKNAEIAKLLTATGPDAAAKLQYLLAATQRRQSAAAIGKVVGGAAARGGIAAFGLPQLSAPAGN
jgi:hypothetical protein